MQRVSQSLSVVMLIMTTVMVGCASVPTQEMSDARQAIKAAHHVKAEYYVPTNLALAKQSLKQAEQHLEQNQLHQARLAALLAKKQAVNAHNMTVAINRAKMISQAIIQLNYSANNVSQLLEQALITARHNEVDQTIALAEEAYHQGQLALNQAQLKQASILIEKVKSRQSELHPHEINWLKLAEAAYRRHQGKQAYELISRVLKQ